MRILPALRLTDTQKQVLAKILASPTPKVAGEQISKDQNSIAARDILVKLGLITYLNGNAALTDKGQQIAQDEDVENQGGDLTQSGEQDAFGDEGADQMGTQDINGLGSEPELAPIGGEPVEEPEPPRESLRLVQKGKMVKTINEETSEKKSLVRRVSKQDIKESEYKSFSTFFKSI